MIQNMSCPKVRQMKYRGHQFQTFIIVPCRRCGRDGKLTYANRQKGTYLIYHAKDDRCQNISSDEYEYSLNWLEQRLGKPISRSIPIEKIREMKYEKLRLNQ